MANDLTGDFDLVAEFALTAANRVLAAMHRDERFPHSLTLRVDDNPPPGSVIVRPSVVASVDAFGEATVNHETVRTLTPVSGQLYAGSPLATHLNPVVNGGFTVPPVVPSKLQGRAQLQISPPLLELSDQTGTRVAVRMQIRSRYFPDPKTPPVAEFIRGELHMAADVSQVATQAANVIDIDIKADTAEINFVPENQTLSTEDLAAINQLIRNALKTGFLPSNNPLPPEIRFIQFKTLPGAENAIAVLLNTQSARGDAGSFQNNFLGAGDDFAFAVGKDFIVAAFQPVINGILSTPIPPFTISINLLFGSIDITYTMSLNSVTLDLAPGKLVLTIKGHAHTGSSIAPSFDFTVTQNFGLTLDGATADLVVAGVSVDTSSAIADLFKSRALPSIEQARDQALANSNAAGAVRQLLSADANVGSFLKVLLTTKNPDNTAQSTGFQLAYTSVDIEPAGVILHGSLAVTWPPAHAEFEKIPGTPRGPGGIIATGADYSALKSWIPGGTIQQFEWNAQGEAQPFLIDQDKFVLLAPPPAITTGDVVAYSPFCLTLRGTRPPISGAGPMETVNGSVCGYTVHPIVNGVQVSTGGSAPFLAVTRSDPKGLVHVSGETPAPVDRTGARAPNMIVHFATAEQVQLETLTQALQESKRTDAATAILAVTNELAKTPYRTGVLYASDQGGAWRQFFGVKDTSGQVTLIVNAKGNVVWQQRGPLDREVLSGALIKLLIPAAAANLDAPRANLRFRQPAADFVFEYAPDRQVRISKLARPARLVFWKASVRASIDAVRDFQTSAGAAPAQNPVLLAINDGDPASVAHRIAAENKLPGILVVDSNQDISAAYGVKLLPTIVYLDARGLVQEVRYGRH
jgi:hypothetical protein